MPENQAPSTVADALRQRAEARFREQSSSTGQMLTEAESQRLIHELQVHQIELELQNEELREARARLEQSLKNYADLYDFAPMGYFTLTSDGAIQELNLAGAALLGQERSRLIGRRFGGFVSMESRLTFNAFLDQTLAGAAKQCCEVALALNGAPLRHVHLECVCKEADAGRQYRLAAADITARRGVEEALRLSEAQYRAVIETSQDGFWVVDRAGRLLEANETYARLSGYSADELRSMRIADLEASESPVEIAAHMEKIIQEGSGGDLFQTRHRAKSGRVWQAEINVSYWPIGGGRFFVFIRDLNRRQQFEVLLKARLRLSDIAHQGSLNDLLQALLDTAEQLTGSQIGFFHFVDPDQERLTLQAWSTHTLKSMCATAGQGLHYPISEAGVWVECVHRRAPVIHNDYASLPHKKGLPEGHAPVIRELTVPILRNALIVAIIGVGNKPEDYTDDDVTVVRQLASLAMDLVERKQIEQTLRYYERIVAATPDAVALLDRNYVYLAVNAEYLRRIGKPREAIVGRSVGEIMGEGVFQTLLKDKLDRCLAGELVQYQFWFDVPTQGRQFLDVSYAPYRAETGAIAGVVVNSRDITDLKWTEEALRKSEACYRAIVQDQTEIISRFTPDGVFTFVNEAYCRFFGKTSQELLGDEWQPNAVAEDQPRIQEKLCVLSPAIPVVVIENRVHSGAGEVRWMQFVNRAFFDPEGRIIEIQSVGRDVTALKQTEERLCASEAKIQSIFRAAPPVTWSSTPPSTSWSARCAPSKTASVGSARWCRATCSTITCGSSARKRTSSLRPAPSC